MLGVEPEVIDPALAMAQEAMVLPLRVSTFSTSPLPKLIVSPTANRVPAPMMVGTETAPKLATAVAPMLGDPPENEIPGTVV